MVRPGLASLLLLTFLLAVPAQASHGSGCAPEDCMAIVPLPDVPYLQGPVGFQSFSAAVDVQDALAKTSLRLALSNPGPAAAEAVVSLPLPDGASLVAFNLSWPGHLVEGQVKERGQAIQAYVEAAEQGRDAAILQQADRHLVSLRVNVGAGEARVLQASYVEPVPLAAGHRVYRLPLSGLDPAPDALRVDVSVASSLGVAGLRTPGLAIPLANGHGSLDLADPASVEDLVLVWGEEGAARSMLVAASDPAAGATEYWAQLCADGAPLARDVVFVLDQSGSMAGLKMEEGRQTLAAALESVHPADRYSIVMFSDDALPFRDALVPGDASHVGADRTKVAAQVTLGATNIDAALQEAFRQLNAAESSRLPMVVFMTDGLPTVGITEHDQIIRRAQGANLRHAPIHVVPIGLDADQTFLADLALRSGGAFVDTGVPDEATSDRLARLLQVIAGAVVMEPKLAITGATVEQVLPRVLPPLYADSCLDVRFRATATGPIHLRLTGTGATGSHVHEAAFGLAAIPVEPAVSALYGRALVADLLAIERLEPSAALRQAIVANATAHSQLSPYTAWVLADTAPAPAAEGSPDMAVGAPAPAGSSAGMATGAATGTPTYSGTYSQLATGTGGAGGDPSVDHGASGDADDSASTPGVGFAALAGTLALLALALSRRSRR